MVRSSTTVAVIAMSVWAGDAGQRPIFQGAPVDLIRLHVQVLTPAGDPVRGLTADDFRVEIDGVARSVPAAAYVPVASTGDDVDGPVRTPGVVRPEARAFVLALDEPGLSAAAPAELTPILQRFARRLHPHDVLAVYPFSYQPAPLHLTHQRAVLPSLVRSVGAAEPLSGALRLTSSEVIDITAGDERAIKAVATRACGADEASCRQAVRAEAVIRASEIETDAERRLKVLSELVLALGGLPGRKHLVVISGALTSATRAAGRPDLSGAIAVLGDLVASSDLLLYAVHWASIAPAQTGRDMAANRDADGHGLELLAGRANTAFFRIQNATNADAVFDRILRETSAHYVLGVRPAPDRRDGVTHRTLRVTVPAKRVLVRSPERLGWSVR